MKVMAAISPPTAMRSSFRTRGRFQSEGVWHMLTDDGRDGVDTCAWIAKQPWSNAQVGTMGSSYVGGTQHAIALEQAPELATAIPIDAMSNLGYASMRNGGAFELRFWNGSIPSPGRTGVGRHAIRRPRQCSRK